MQTILRAVLPQYDGLGMLEIVSTGCAAHNMLRNLRTGSASAQTRQRVGPQRAAKSQAVKVLRQSSVDLQDDPEDDSISAYYGGSHQVGISHVCVDCCMHDAHDSYLQIEVQSVRQTIRQP